MNKKEILELLSEIEERYSDVPEEYKLYGELPDEDEYKPNKQKRKRLEGTVAEVTKILNQIGDDQALLNDEDIGLRAVKLAPITFGNLGNKARENEKIFMEACRGDIGEAFEKAGNIILDDTITMFKVLRINPDLYYQMRPYIQNNSRIITEFVKRAGLITESAATRLPPKSLKELKPYYTHRVEGMREEQYTDFVCHQTDGEFYYTPTILTKTIICTTRGEDKFEIELTQSSDKSPDDMATANYGKMSVKKVKEFGEMSKVANGKPIFELIYGDNIRCPAFEVSRHGADQSRPRGYFKVNDDLFLRRYKDSEERRNMGEQLREFLTKTKNFVVRPTLVMADGTEMSIQASENYSCTPKENGLRRYGSFEVRTQDGNIEQLRNSKFMTIEGDNGLPYFVYDNVSRKFILDILQDHGGINLEATLDSAGRLDDLKLDRAILERRTTLSREVFGVLQTKYEELRSKEDVNSGLDFG